MFGGWDPSDQLRLEDVTGRPISLSGPLRLSVSLPVSSSAGLYLSLLGDGHCRPGAFSKHLDANYYQLPAENEDVHHDGAEPRPLPFPVEKQHKNRMA